MSKNNYNQNGYILLISLLVVGAVSIAGVLAILINGTDSSKTALISQQSVAAKDSAEACTELALHQILANSSYAGTGNSSMANSSCNYTVVYDEGDFIISSTGTSGSSTRKIKVYATILSSSISVISWQEVASL